MASTYYNLLKLDQNFNKQCDTAYADLKKGIIGNIDGVTIVVVPISYLPANTGYLFVYNQIAVKGQKLDMILVLTHVEGVHGAVAECSTSLTMASSRRSVQPVSSPTWSSNQKEFERWQIITQE